MGKSGDKGRGEGERVGIGGGDEGGRERMAGGMRERERGWRGWGVG